MRRAGDERLRLSERLTRGAPLAVILVGIALIAYQLLPVLKIVALAMLLALIFRTVVNGLGRLKIPNWLAVLTLVAGILALLAFVWLVVIPRLMHEIRSLVSEGPGSLDALSSFLSGLPLAPGADQLLQRLESFLLDFLGSVPQLAVTAAEVIGAILTMLILAVYFAASPGTYISGGLRLVPVDRREAVREFIDRLGKRLRGWVLGTVMVASFVGVSGGVGLWLLDIPLPLTFGLIAGILDVVPFVGSVAGGALPALIALTISPVKALLVVGLFVIVNQIEGNILQPLIMGNEIKVPVAGILVSFLALGLLLGPVVGAILAVPAAVVASVLIDELTEREPFLGDEDNEDNAGNGSTEDSGDKEAGAREKAAPYGESGKDG
ncbi:AI-2E family transporter [Rubrobacter aplysinae]|uniref:AI-2E family transporter n=1 Tax=Rubrobacter aplysinae TaxID=909625 RepID=UPI00069D978A|nr:AI-2E family transporter [Rubrobacter aplysinae]